MKTDGKKVVPGFQYPELVHNDEGGKLHTKFAK